MASSGLDPAELIEKALVVENLIALKPSITMSDETLRDKLTIHFQQRKSNRGGDVKYVIYPVNSCCKDVAIVLFEDGKVRESAVQHEQVFLSQLLKVRRFPPVITSIKAKIDPLFVSIMPHESASAIPSTLQRILGAHVNPGNWEEISCSHKAQLDHVEREVFQLVFPQKMTVGDHSLVEGATGICEEPSRQQHRSFAEFGAVGLSKHKEIPAEEKYEESDDPANPMSSSGQKEGPEEFYDAQSDGGDKGLDDDAGVIVDKYKYKYLRAFQPQYFQKLSKKYSVKFVEKKGDDIRVVVVALNKKVPAHNVDEARDKFIEFYQKASYDIERKTIDCSSVSPRTKDEAMKKMQDVFKTDTLIIKADKSQASCSCIILRRGDVEEVARHFREAAGIKSRKLRTTAPSSDNNMDTSPAVKAIDHQRAKKATRNEPATGPLNSPSTSYNTRQPEGDNAMGPMKFVTNEGMNIMVLEGDIIKQEVAAIVNPSTSTLDNFGGVATAIVRAAGSGLEKDCCEIMNGRQWQHFQVTQCVTTSGFNLKSLIIHAVGPTFASLNFGSELHQTFLNCLHEANQRHLPSLAIPLIGAGTQGAYKKVCSDALVGALVQFSYETGRHRFVRDVLLVNIDKESTTIIQCSLQTAFATPNNSACLASGSTLTLGSNISQSTSGKGQRPGVASEGQPMLHGIQQATSYDSPKATESRGHGRENPTSTGMQTRSQYVGKDNNVWPTPSESKEHIKNQKHPTSGKAEDEEAHKNRRALHDANSADKAVVSTRDQSSPHDAKLQAQATEDKRDKCPICFEDKMIDAVVLQCKHRFCRACIDRALESSYRCPVCKAVCGQPKGNQPKGTMTKTINNFWHLPGYQKDGVITINYDIPGGIQSADHPNPGKHFGGTSRTAYLPDNQEGREVLGLLRKAFDAGLVFTVGTSVTSGGSDRVTWNDIHHKTSMSGGPQNYGYPDPGYLKRVKEDLAAKGIQ